MKANIFITKYKKAENQDAFISQHIKKTYMPFETKVDLAQNIVENAMVDQENRIISNSPAIYLYYIYTIIDFYTDIDYDKEDPLKSFDQLDEMGIVSKIITAIGEDTTYFREILNMTVDDVIANKNSIENKLDIFIDRVKKEMNEAADTFNSFADKLDEMERLQDQEQEKEKQDNGKDTTD